MSDFDIKITNYLENYKNNGHSPIGYQYQVTTSKGTFCVIFSPTGNCQVMSLSNIAGILHTNASKPNYDLTKDEFKLILADIKRDIGVKHLVFCDIKNFYCPKMDKLIEECGFTVVFRNPYRSTNNSDMCMYLIDTTNTPASELKTVAKV